MKTMFALLKREILEHPSIWKVPAIMLLVSGLVKLSFAMGNLSIDVDTPDFLNLDSTVDATVSQVLAKSLWLVNGLISIVMVVLAAFYALSCLYVERQDESVLFWRSLPISDSMTVASKLIIAVVVIPLLIILSHVIVAVVFLGFSNFEYLQQSILASVVLTIKMVAWLLLPLVAWCMFCSEISKRGPFLLAFIAPIVLMIVEVLFFDVGLGDLIINRFYPSNHDSMLLLVTGLGLTVVCIYFAIIKRSQRI